MRAQPVPLHLGLPFGLALSVALGVACGGSTEPAPPAECGEEALPELPSPITELVRGSVSILDKQDFTLDAAGQPTSTVQGRVAATFADFSTVTSTPSGLLAVGSTCLGVASRPVTSGAPRRLDLSRLAVAGSALGALTVARTSTGVFALAEASLLMAGATSLRITADGAPGGFPAFEVDVPAAAKLELLAPRRDGSANLLVDDVEVAWTPGDGDWVEVSIFPKVAPGASDGGGGQITCLAADDGCFTIPASATTFLLAAQAPTYTLSVARHRAARAQPAAGVAVDVSAVSEARVTLVNGVLGP